MAKTALLSAVRDLLCQEFRLREGVDCEHTPDGRPLPNAGDFFVAVHYGGQSSSPSSTRSSLDRLFGVQVTLSMRLVGPLDRAAGSLIQRRAQTGLEDYCEDIIAFLHMNTRVVTLANEYLRTATRQVRRASAVVYGFSEPLSFSGDLGNPAEASATWFGASQQSEARSVAPAGYYQTLTFGEARRVQPLETLRQEV